MLEFASSRFTRVLCLCLRRTCKPALTLALVSKQEEAVLKALAFYDSCMDTERINKLKGEPLKDLLERFGSWAILDSEWDESSWDFVSQMVELQRNLTLSTFISLFVDLDLKNSSQNVLVVSKIRPCTVSGHEPTLPWVRLRVWVRVG